MASSGFSSTLADLPVNFFLCSVCLDQFKEPKLLPCLHRCCRDCLDKVILNDGTLKCPICTKTCKISKDGVNGFNTDFHMKSMLEFIQLQKTFENMDLKECVSCSKTVQVFAYCFKCRAFLCDHCGQFHRVNAMFRDHKQHILTLENSENKKFMLEKLATLRENPRCRHHVKQEAQLCCSTCENMPVCVTCVYGKHKGHDLHDVVEVAEGQRESLRVKLQDINRHKDKLYELPKVVEKSMEKLRERVRNESEKINLQYRQRLGEIEDKMNQEKADREKNIENIKTQMEKEINEIRRKWEEEMKQVESKYDLEFKETDKKHNDIMKELQGRREKLDCNLREMKAERKDVSKPNEIELRKISDYCEQTIKRYENFAATTSCILESNDRWADAQCIPDIRAAGECLMEEMKKEFPEVESLANIKFENVSSILPDVVTISHKTESVLDVEGFQTNGLHVSGVTNVSDGKIVITGCANIGCSHITVVDRDGRIQRQALLKRYFSYYPYRHCCSLSEVKVATISKSHEVGIYDVGDGSYNSKNIKKFITNYGTLTCVTTDPAKDHILVGTTGIDVYVFDDQLNYMKSIQLPDVARHQVDICVHGSNLLVCSNNGSAYTVTMEESISHVLSEFIKPDQDRGEWKPTSLCTDKSGSIFMLWVAISFQERHILLQYSQDGRQILTQIRTDRKSVSMTTVKDDDGELIMVATRDTGKLYTYRLTEK